MAADAVALTFQFKTLMREQPAAVLHWGRRAEGGREAAFGGDGSEGLRSDE